MQTLIKTVNIVPTTKNTFRTPVYTTSKRRNAMGVGLVFEADLETREHINRWILQGVCLTLNDDEWWKRAEIDWWKRCTRKSWGKSIMTHSFSLLNFFFVLFSTHTFLSEMYFFHQIEWNVKQANEEMSDKKCFSCFILSLIWKFSGSHFFLQLYKISLEFPREREITWKKHLESFVFYVENFRGKINKFQHGEEMKSLFFESIVQIKYLQVSLWTYLWFRCTMEDSGIDSGDRVANFMVSKCENSQTYVRDSEKC